MNELSGRDNLDREPSDAADHSDAGARDVPPALPSPPTDWAAGRVVVPPEPVQAGRNGSSGSSIGKVVAVIGAVIVAGLIGTMIGYRAGSTTGGTAESGPADTTSPTSTDVPVSTTPGQDVELTEVQKQAVLEARTHFYPESRVGLIGWLMEYSDGQYSEADATVAVDSLNIDWVEEARKKAYFEVARAAYSKPGLVVHLSSETEGFTRDEAKAAVEGLDVDWSIQPERYAREYADSSSVSRQYLLGVMTGATGGFTEDEATSGIDAAKIDFDAEAEEKAKNVLERETATTCEEVIEILTVGSEFTPEQAQHGAQAAGAC